MRYFKVMDNVHVPGRWYLGKIVVDDGWQPNLTSGIPFQGNVAAEIHRPGRPLDFCLTGFAVPVVAQRLGAEIGAITQSDVQRLPLSIRGHQGFEALNVLRVVRCLDEERSKFVKWTEKDHRADLAGQYRSVPELRIRSGDVPHDAHVFRIEGWLIALIVSETVKIAMENAGCLGAKFQEVT